MLAFLTFHQFYLLSSLSFSLCFFSRSPEPCVDSTAFTYQSPCQLSQKRSQEWSKHKKGRFATNCDVSAAETECPQLQPRTPASASLHTHSTSSLKLHCSARPFINHCWGLICLSHKVNRHAGGLQKQQMSPLPHKTPTRLRKHHSEELSKKQIPVWHSH